MKKKPLIDKDGNVREITSEEMREFRPAKEVLSPKLYRALTKGRGPQKAPTKRLISLRLDVDVIEHFRSSGPGWQSRINKTLKRFASRAK